MTLYIVILTPMIVKSTQTPTATPAPAAASTTALGTEDEALLALLQENARFSTAALARRLGVARSTVQGRLERLERSGVIRGYGVRLSPAALARQVEAHVMISIEPAQQVAIERRLKAIRGLTALYTVSGNFDLVAMLGAETTEALDAALDEIRGCPGVRATQSAVLLSRRHPR